MNEFREFKVDLAQCGRAKKGDRIKPQNRLFREVDNFAGQSEPDTDGAVKIALADLRARTAGLAALIIDIDYITALTTCDPANGNPDFAALSHLLPPKILFLEQDSRIHPAPLEWGVHWFYPNPPDMPLNGVSHLWFDFRPQRFVYCTGTVGFSQVSFWDFMVTETEPGRNLSVQPKKKRPSKKYDLPLRNGNIPPGLYLPDFHLTEQWILEWDQRLERLEIEIQKIRDLKNWLNAQNVEPNSYNREKIQEALHVFISLVKRLFEEKFNLLPKTTDGKHVEFSAFFRSLPDRLNFDHFKQALEVLDSFETQIDVFYQQRDNWLQKLKFMGTGRSFYPVLTDSHLDIVFS